MEEWGRVKGRLENWNREKENMGGREVAALWANKNNLTLEADIHFSC